MPTRPTLLFLHGVGSGDKVDNWRTALSQSLVEVGYEGIDAANVIAPKYPNTLRGSDDDDPLPPITIKAPTGETADRFRRNFERRMGAIEVLLGQHDPGNGWFGAEVVTNVAIDLKPFDQANNYISDNQIRAQVLNRVLKRVPDSGRLVIVGHSLGSVIAADLLRRLPAGLEVAGLITLGSPLAHPRFHVERLRSLLSDPPSNLGWWVNFWNDADPVTTHKGVSSIFPWMIDHRVRTPLGLGIHDAVTYLSNETAATAIGYGLFGSRSKALTLAGSGIRIPLDYAETVALIAIRYAHLILEQLEGDRRERFAEALRHVQASTVDLIRQRDIAEDRPVPREIAELSIDLANPDSVTPSPSTLPPLSKDEAVVVLLSVVAANVIQPFEIEVNEGKRQRALEKLTLELGIGSQIGTNVFRAADRARDELKGATNWIKWAAIGLGAAALVAATGGLALAAAPGVAGAAAITSALAAFGPGGMIGGLLSAGALVSAGGGSLALGLASPSTTAATLEAVVASQLAAAILRELEGIRQDAATWNGLVAIGMELRREYARLEPISDKSAPTLKELQKKLQAVERALAYLERRKLTPHAPMSLDRT